MFHPDFCEQTASLPPSILAQAASRATRALSCSIPELGELNIDDPRAQEISDLLDKVVGAYQKKKMAAKNRRTVVRAAARPAVAEAATPEPVTAAEPCVPRAPAAPSVSQIVVSAPAPAPSGAAAAKAALLPP